MKERPILFSGAMVRAILEGRKTQTRRVVTFREYGKTYHFDNADPLTSWNFIERIGILNHGHSEIPCPYGIAGNRLWVRETFAIDTESLKGYAQPMYRADGGSFFKWKPSIFMPRNVSRINLEVTHVRVERVADISDLDSFAEGVYPCGHDAHRCTQWTCSYQTLWNQINAKRGYGWSKNPWVWVIEFRNLTHGQEGAQG